MKLDKILKSTKIGEVMKVNLDEIEVNGIQYIN